jgi:hypothetical protein
VSNKREKAKTSINIDRETWSEWVKFVVIKTGSARKISEELEKALKEYMKKHGRTREFTCKHRMSTSMYNIYV